MKCPAFPHSPGDNCLVCIKSFFLKDKTNAVTFVNRACFKKDILLHLLKKTRNIYIPEFTFFFFYTRLTKDPRTAAHFKRYVLSTSANLSEETINRRLAAEREKKDTYNETVNSYLGYANRCYPRHMSREDLRI